MHYICVQGRGELYFNENDQLFCPGVVQFYFLIGGYTQGSRSYGAAGAAAPVAQIVRGQHGDKRLPFLQELHF